MKLPVLGLGYISLSCWLKGFHGKPPHGQAVDKSVSFLPQTDFKAPLLKATPTQLGEQGGVELVPTQSLHSYGLVSLAQEGTLPATNPATNNGVLTAKYARAMMAQNFWE